MVRHKDALVRGSGKYSSPELRLQYQGSEHIVLRERKVLTLIRCDGEQWLTLLIGGLFLLNVSGIHLPSPRIHNKGVTLW